jgi:SprT protein
MYRTDDPDFQDLCAAARRRTLELLRSAARDFAIRTPRVEIRFDLCGQAAGQVRLPSHGPALIRYNAQLLWENREGFLARTVPHEVAHVLAWRLYGTGLRPHGPEWKALMAHFCAEPSRCHPFDTGGTRTRHLARHAYHCDCREHALTSIRHNRILRGQQYLCRRCGATLRPGACPDTGPQV